MSDIYTCEKLNFEAISAIESPSLRSLWPSCIVSPFVNGSPAVRPELSRRVPSCLPFQRHREGQSPVAISFLFLQGLGYSNEKKKRTIKGKYMMRKGMKKG
jgi:hypothetical protein